MALGRGTIVALWLFSALLGSARAHALPAAEPRATLTYQVEPSLSGCPTAEELRAGIATQLGSDPFASDPSVADQRISIAIGRSSLGSPAGVTEAHITWFDASGERQGERRLSSENGDCAELATGVVFAVAVQIQLHAAATRSQTRETQPAAPPPPPPRAPIVVPAPPQAPRTHVLAGVGVYAQRGLSPDTTAGLRVFGALEHEAWSVDLGVQTTLPTDRRLNDGTGFEARDLSAKLAPCVRLRPVGVCAVGMVGGLFVRGYGVDRAESPRTLVAGVGARLQLAWPRLEHFGVLINAEVVALLTPRDVLLNRSVAWSTDPTVIGVGLDLAAVFR